MCVCLSSICKRKKRILVNETSLLVVGFSFMLKSNTSPVRDMCNIKADALNLNITTIFICQLSILCF